MARIDLKDGRTLDLQTTVEPPRPKSTDLINKNVQPGSSHSPVHLTNDSLPQDGRMTFFLKTDIPDSFPRTEKIEVATTDSSFDVSLSLADGNLILQNSQTGDGGARSAQEFWGFRFRSIAVSPHSGRGREERRAGNHWQPWCESRHLKRCAARTAPISSAT